MLDYKTVSTLLKADFYQGTLYWKHRDVIWFKSGKRSAKSNQAIWNAHYENKQAINTDGVRGYKIGTILGKAVSAHRVLWLLKHKEWPLQVDHINGNTSDNTITNLRNVTQLENGKNQKLSSRNKSGRIGVHWNKAQRKWRVHISHNTIRIHLGCFENIDDAISVRKEAELKYEYHKNHGRNGHALEAEKRMAQQILEAAE